MLAVAVPSLRADLAGERREAHVRDLLVSVYRGNQPGRPKGAKGPDRIRVRCDSNDPETAVCSTEVEWADGSSKGSRGHPEITVIR